MILGAEGIAAAPDLPHEDVEVPEWGGSVRLQCLSATERMAWERATFEGSEVDTDEFLFGLLARCLVDDAGQPLFDTEEGKKILGAKNQAVLQRLQKIAARVNGMGAEAAEEAEK